MYELGSIVRNGGDDFLTYMYKGNYYKFGDETRMFKYEITEVAN